MALIKCSECGNEVSDQAKTCPKCGVPLKVINQKRCEGTTVEEETKWVKENDPEFVKSLKLMSVIGTICVFLCTPIAIVLLLIMGIRCKTRGYNKNGNLYIVYCFVLFALVVVLLAVWSLVIR